jgi:hypothetical protein
MRELISEHPNIVPVGIGNSAATIDMSTYLEPASHSDDYETPNSVDASDEEGESNIIASTATSKGQDVRVTADQDNGCDDDSEDIDIHVPQKRKSSATEPVKQEPKKTRTMMEKFSDVVKVQEETVQKSMDIKVRQLELTTDTDIARIKSNEHIQVERDKRRAELKLQKIKLEQDKLHMDHELKLAQLHASCPATATSQMPMSLGSGSASFSTGSSSQAFSSPAMTQAHLELDESFFASLSLPPQHTPLFLPDHCDTSDA